MSACWDFRYVVPARATSWRRCSRQGVQSIRSYKTQTFARWLADVTLADGSDLGAWIVAQGLGNRA